MKNKGLDLGQALFVAFVLLKWGFKVEMNFLILFSPLVLSVVLSFANLILLMLGVNTDMELFVAKKYAAYMQRKAIRQGNKTVQKMNRQRSN